MLLQEFYSLFGMCSWERYLDMSEMAQALCNREVNLYDVLNICTVDKTRHIDSRDVKIAFRRALLLHHPDKVSKNVTSDKVTRGSRTSGASAKYTVDEICYAREILSSPSLRRKYDQECLAEELHGRRDGYPGFLPAQRRTLEEVDLDDMEFNEAASEWSRVCRCGNRQAFRITEEDLEDVATTGALSIIAGCEGCSLHVKVVFATVADTV